MIRRVLICAALAISLTACGKKTAGPGPDAAANGGDGAAFLAKNAKAPGVQVTASGLQYKIVRSGPPTAPSPKIGDEIKINYEGTLITGDVFDSSYKRGAPAAMPLDHLVPGWMEALPKMHVGDEWFIYLPAKLGYGERGAGPIPPNSVLVFRIELLGVLPTGGSKRTANA